MVIIPKDRPLIQNLNSYYLHVSRMLEHYQGEVGSGAIHFKSSSTEGVIFFDRDEFLDGICENNEEKLTGKGAIDFLTGSSDVNYTISIYGMEPDQVYFWSSIPTARRIYEDLSTDFTDLDGLMRKMIAEKLTGYIEVSLDNHKDNALIFYHNGQIVGGSYSWDQGEVTGSKENLGTLVEKTKQSGGTFHVSRITMTRDREGPTEEAAGDQPSPEVITAVEELLGLFERVVGSSKSAKGDFRTLLKKQFLARAETYEFLDPFSGEFQYADRKVKFSGKANDERMIKAVLEAVRGLAENLQLGPELHAKSAGWFQKYHVKLTSLGIAR